MKVEIGLEDLERLLQSPAPREYADYVKKSKPADLMRRGFDPKTLCVLNLGLRDGDKQGWTRDRFFLSGDGSGNYFFAANGAAGDSTKVLLWSHDPPGIEDPRKSLSTFLNTAIQENPITQTVAADRFCIARTEVVGESILNPILLEEWMKAISLCDGVSHRGYLIGTNPFTQEKLKFDRPGLAVVTCDGKEVVLQLSRGRVSGQYAPKVRPIAEALANALHAKLNIGSD